MFPPPPPSNAPFVFHGVLTPQDMVDLRAAKKRVAELLSDGQWHASPQIVEAGGAEGLRRARELRNLPGVTLEKRRLAGKRVWEYRIRRTT